MYLIKGLHEFSKKNYEGNERVDDRYHHDDHRGGHNANASVKCETNTHGAITLQYLDEGWHVLN